jgi:hypothetical protein
VRLSLNIETALGAHYRFLAEFLWFFARKSVAISIIFSFHRDPGERRQMPEQPQENARNTKKKEIFAIAAVFGGEYIAVLERPERAR